MEALGHISIIIIGAVILHFFLTNVVKVAVKEALQEFKDDVIKGNGLTSELLIKNGIKVYTENDLDKIELL